MKKRIISLLLTLVLILSAVPVSAHAATMENGGSCGNELTWTLDNEGTLIISGIGSMPYFQTIMGPGILNSDKDKIPPWYEQREKIKTVVLENGVTSIGSDAFYACVNLTSVEIPESVISINSFAFNQCRSLRYVEIPESVRYFGSCVFFQCESLAHVDLPGNLTKIEYGMFSGCSSLTSIDIPEGVTAIEDTAFTGCSSLISIDIPESVTSIGAWVFSHCNSLTSIDIPEGVTAIGNAAFSDCSSLTSIDIPEGVTAIGNATFSDCRSLTSIEIPENVITIGEAAFSGCYSLKSVAMAQNVISIGDNAFAFCENLMDIYYAGTATEWKNLGKNRPSAQYIHYGYKEETGHWAIEEKIATCKENGYTKEICPCGYERNEEIKPAGHGVTEEICDCDKLATPQVDVANTASTGKAKLSWTAVDGAQEYVVYRATSKSGEYSKVKTTTATSYTDSSAKVGKRYYYKVVAVHENSSANSAKSAAVSAIRDLAQPRVTVKNTASTGKAKLSWAAVDGAETYVVYRATSKSGEYSKVKTTTATSYTDSSAKVGKRYYYKVVAVHENSSANSAKSAEVSAVRDLTQPKASVSLTSKKQAKVKWGEVEGAKEYVIYRATSKDGEYTKLKTTAQTSYTDKSVKSGKTYYYKVVAVHKTSTANSARSTAVKIKVK